MYEAALAISPPDSKVSALWDEQLVQSRCSSARTATVLSLVRSLYGRSSIYMMSTLYRVARGAMCLVDRSPFDWMELGR